MNSPIIKKVHNTILMMYATINKVRTPVPRADVSENNVSNGMNSSKTGNVTTKNISSSNRVTNTIAVLRPTGIFSFARNKTAILDPPTEEGVIAVPNSANKVTFMHCFHDSCFSVRQR